MSGARAIGTILDDHAFVQPEAIAISYGQENRTWRELSSNSDRHAGQLIASGAKQDDIIGVMLPNGVAFHEVTIAVWKVGATPLILSPKLAKPELEAILTTAKPRMVIGEHEASAGIGPTKSSETVIEEVDRRQAVAAPRYWKAVPSGGSTGAPKVIVDHMPGIVDPDTLPFAALGMRAGGVMLNPGPLSHNAPFLFTSFSLLAGARVVGMLRFDAEEALRLIEEHRVEWVCLVPAMMHRIWALPAQTRERYDVTSLRRVWHMAAPCPSWLKRFWIDWLGAEVVWESYGGTEAGGTTISGVEWLAKPGSVGRAAAASLRVERSDGTECAVGEVGEIFFPAAKRDAFHYLGETPTTDGAGRYTIGDLGHVDIDGYLFLADRRVDLILRGGANIYPAEVEAALEEHPSVLASVVIGLPDAELGQQVHAIVQVAASNAPTAEQLDRFVSDRLSPYKRPRSYELTHAEIRDEAGKVRRSRLLSERTAWLNNGTPFQNFVERSHGRTA